MWRSLHDAWWRLATQSHPRSFWDVLASRVLQSGSLAYQAAITLRNAAYDRGWARQVILPCPVVSVGNLTVGGTGKTACVELLARKLTALGARVAILSRGYGGAHQNYWLRWEGGRLEIGGDRSGSNDTALLLADEPQLLAEHLEGVPVVIGGRRDRTGQLALSQFGANTLVLDDGFQHRRLSRNCDVVLLHARTPFGGWAMLPRGPMREPFSSVARADVVILTKADEALETLNALSERVQALNPDAALVTATHEPCGLLDVSTGVVHDPQSLSGVRVGLFSSIGDPEGFESTVRRLHASPLWHVAFPDHHRYAAADWEAVVRRSKAARPQVLLTTEKDWVRLRAVARDQPAEVPVRVLRIQMKLLSGERALDDRLARLYVR